MISKNLLGSGLVCQLTKLEPHILHDWCVRGILSPVKGGMGQGDHRKFSFLQVTGILVGQTLRESERGCLLAYLGQIAAAFGGMDEDWLQQEFAAGRTHFVMVTPEGKPVLATGKYDWVDVKSIYRGLLARVSDSRRPQVV